MNPNPEKPSIQQIITALGLQPLPAEGGMFVQSYRSSENISARALPARYPAQPKPFGTAIYYLITNEPDSFSALHRLLTDEVLHFYLGDPLETLLLYPGGSSRTLILGKDILAGQHLQFVIPQGVWQGSRLAEGGEYALIGSTMAPGFTNEDYEGGEREALCAQYPHEARRIRLLTRQNGLLRMS